MLIAYSPYDYITISGWHNDVNNIIVISCWWSRIVSQYDFNVHRETDKQNNKWSEHIISSIRSLCSLGRDHEC